MSLTPLTPLAPLADVTLPSANTVSNAANKILGAALGGPAALLFGVSASRLIAIAVGLILVAAAVFSFRPAREVIVGTAKKGAEVAALAA